MGNMMRIIHCLSLAIVIILAPDTAFCGQETLPLRSVEGVWRTEAISIGGKRVDEPRKGDPVTTFTNSEMIIDDGGNVYRFKYTIDTTVDPCEMDQTIERDGRAFTTKSIYKREGNMLTIASSRTPGSPRPKSFSPSQTPDLMVTSMHLLSPEELKELRKMGEDADGEAAMAALRKLGARFDMNTNRMVRTVMLSHTSVSEPDLKHLAKFKELDSVSLVETSVGNGGMTNLAALGGLKRLNLSMTAVDDTGLQALVGLAHLEELDLIGTGVTDASVNTLSKLSRLKDVDLSLTRVTSRGKERLRQALPDCSVR
jgi:uncharacterized protein (TIGR03067 family)